MELGSLPFPKRSNVKKLPDKMDDRTIKRLIKQLFRSFSWNKQRYSPEVIDIENPSCPGTASHEDRRVKVRVANLTLNLRIRRGTRNVLEMGRPMNTVARASNEADFSAQVSKDFDAWTFTDNGRDRRETAEKMPETLAIILEMKSGNLVRVPPGTEVSNVIVVSTYTDAPNFSQIMSTARARFSNSSCELMKIAKHMARIHNRRVEHDVGLHGELYLCANEYVLYKIGLHTGDRPTDVSKSDRRNFRNMSSSFFNKWGVKPERLKPSLGDAHSKNLLLSKSSPRSEPTVVPFDFRGDPAFPQVADPGLDVGTMYADLMWHGYLLRSAMIRKNAERFVFFYEQLTKDDSIRSAACIGIAFRTAMFMNPNYTSAEDRSRSGGFFDKMKVILKRGSI